MKLVKQQTFGSTLQPYFKDKYVLKGIIHPKIEILSLITHPHVVPNP